MNDNAPFPVVGIGASVGGLRALEDFFKSLPADPDMAFVVIPQLAPDQESFLAEIPARHTSLPLHAASDGQKVDANRASVLPSNASLTIAGRRREPEEASLLFRDLLINVPSFFRDPEAFESLRTNVIPRLFVGRGAGNAVRVWRPGCSTCEQVISIALLLREHMHRLPAAPRVIIFAADIDEHALGVATEARDLCVFSPHNLLRDPPFSRIDLISCRNVLIYFGAVPFGLARKRRTKGDGAAKYGVRRQGRQRRNRTQPFRRRHFRLRGNGLVGAARNCSAARAGDAAMTREAKRPPGGKP
jgi:hypothetical protein